MKYSNEILNCILNKISSKDHYYWITDKRECFDYFHLSSFVRIVQRLCTSYIFVYKNTFFNSILTKSEKLGRPVPLRNIGLNCYLNSSFQSIVACNCFVKDMKQLEQIYPTSKALLIFNKILSSLSDDNNSDDIELSTNAILRNWNRSGEQDTFEILSYVIFQVFNELRKIQQDHLPLQDRTIQNWNNEKLPLKLFIEFKMKCDCGHSFFPTIQTDLALHLPIPFRVYSDNQPFTIESLLDNYFVPENIVDFSCLNPNCKNGEVTKFIILQKPMPTTFCIHIQRSFWNPNNNIMEKNNENILFNEKLILKKDFFSEDRIYPDGPLSLALLEMCKSEDLFSVVEEDLSDNRHSKKRKNLDNNRLDELDNIFITSELINQNDVSRNLKKNDNYMYIGDIISCTSTHSSDYIDTNNHDVNIESSFIKEELLDEATNEITIEDNQKLHGEMDINKSDKPFYIEAKTTNDSFISDFLDDNITTNSYAINILPKETYSMESNSKCGQCAGDLNKEYVISEEYYLKSVIVHFGRAESGHYICYRKCANKWFCTNDNFVTEVTFKEVQNSQAYILMYENDN